MIETLITELTAALKENTAALRDVLAASSADVKVVHTITPAPAPEPAKKGKAAKAAPAPVEQAAPAPAPEETPAEATTPEPEPDLTPTKVPTAPAKDDTPHVPAPVAPGQPEAGEHVDVDEVLAQITSTLKKKMVDGDAKAVQDAFVVIRKGYNVERINELRSQPAKLLEVLRKTQAL